MAVLWALGPTKKLEDGRFSSILYFRLTSKELQVPKGPRYQQDWAEDPLPLTYCGDRRCPQSSRRSFHFPEESR